MCFSAFEAWSSVLPPHRMVASKWRLHQKESVTVASFVRRLSPSKQTSCLVCCCVSCRLFSPGWMLWRMTTQMMHQTPLALQRGMMMSLSWETLKMMVSP